VEMDGPCIHFHPFHGARRYIIHPSTPGLCGMDAWKWKQGCGRVGGSWLGFQIPCNSGGGPPLSWLAEILNTCTTGTFTYKHKYLPTQHNKRVVDISRLVSVSCQSTLDESRVRCLGHQLPVLWRPSRQIRRIRRTRGTSSLGKTSPDTHNRHGCWLS
jgi:hypothetical protein